MGTPSPKHSFTVGTILYSTWGYEQTNASFYQVVAIPSPQFVTVRRVKHTITESSPLAMSGNSVPNKDDFDGEPFNKKVVKKYKSEPHGDDCIRISSYSTAELWDGQPVSVSWYG